MIDLSLKLPRLECPKCNKSGMSVGTDANYGQGDCTHNNYVHCHKCGFEEKVNGGWNNEASYEELEEIANKYYKQ